MNEFGQAVSVFGTIYEGIAVDTAPAISATRAALILASVGNGVVGPESEQELVVLAIMGGTNRVSGLSVRSSPRRRTACVFSRQ